MSRDDRKENETPVPSVHLDAVDRELREFLNSEARERAAGFTKKAMLESIHTLQTALMNHVAEDAKFHAATERKLVSHSQRLSHLERRADAEDAAKAEANEKKAPLSIPPMRVVENTGSYDLNQIEIEKAKALIHAMEMKNAADLQAIRDAQTAKELAEKTAIIVELKESRKWWGQNSIQWVVAGVGGFAAIVATAVIMWLVGKK